MKLYYSKQEEPRARGIYFVTRPDHFASGNRNSRGGRWLCDICLSYGHGPKRLHVCKTPKVASK